MAEVKGKPAKKIRDMKVVHEEVKEEGKYTLEQAAQEMKRRQEQLVAEKEARLKSCNEAITNALGKFGCSLRINPESKLNALEIIIVSNT